MDASAVAVREIEWTPELTTALEHPSISCLSWLEREVRGGVSQLWECTCGADRLYVVTRLDHNPQEWVWCYARGSGIAKFAAHFLAVAERKRWRVRIHTTSPALVRMARRYGFGQPEFILRR